MQLCEAPLALTELAQYTECTVSVSVCSFMALSGWRRGVAGTHSAVDRSRTSLLGILGCSPVTAWASAWKAAGGSRTSGAPTQRLSNGMVWWVEVCSRRVG